MLPLELLRLFDRVAEKLSRGPRRMIPLEQWPPLEPIKVKHDENERSREDPYLHSFEDIIRNEAGPVHSEEVIIGQIPPFAVLGRSSHKDVFALAPPLFVTDLSAAE